MNKKVFIDSDVILDVLCKRIPHYQYSAQIFTLGDLKKINLYTTSLSFANVYYILRKTVGGEKAKYFLRKLRLLIKILAADEKETDLALNSKFTDFEDALQYYTALKHNMEVILTRNVKDYKEKDIIVQTPEHFVKNYEKI
ncbi:type II toxin-antitoxin system VapC family toxin [Treponema sp.]|uniref:type II toxin-antitoxin system VapC family toxin n=1 Tax=Treponema sp. TaxID=166 RepID=UPI003FA31875